MKFILKFNIIILLLLIIVPRLSHGQTKIKNKPNVLFIIVDQLRRYSGGYWSENPYRKYVIGKPDPVITPTLDYLAKTGVVATRCISNYSICSPARGMILSGMFPEQNGLWNNAKIGRSVSLKTNIPILTDLFYKNGFNTSYFGKTHWQKPDPLFDEDGNFVGTKDWPGGHYINKFDTYLPPGQDRHHIQYFYQSVKSSHFSPYVYSSAPKAVKGRRDGAVYKSQEFSTKREANYIIKYLKNKEGQRNKNKPFFMIWSINPPHPSFKDEDTEMGVLHWLYGRYKYPDVDSLIVRKNASTKVAKGYVRNYFSDISSNDKYIGYVLNQLDQMGELDNTIVVFTADHGEMLGSHGLRAKNVLYTESIAVPFIVCWPKGLKPGITDVLIGSPDILPTVMSLAGLKSKIPNSVEGKDLSSFFLRTDSEGVERPRNILLMLINARGLLTDRYELILKEKGKSDVKSNKQTIAQAYIYDNKTDPLQLHKIPLDQRPQLANKLLKELGKKLKFTNDPWYQQKKYVKMIPYPKK